MTGQAHYTPHASCRNILPPVPVHRSFSPTFFHSMHRFAACGLYYLAELIEEFTNTTKRFISWTIRGELLLHIALLIDRLPWHCLALGFLAHVAYLRSLRRFPYMQLSSSEGIASSLAFIATNAAWMRYYWSSVYSLEYIAAFMLVTTWVVPFGMFLGLAGDQSVLPGAGGYPYSTPPPASTGRSYGGGGGQEATSAREKPRRGFALRVFDVLRRKRDEVLPEAMSMLPPSTGLYKHKL
jgi:hypothetical protein